MASADKWRWTDEDGVQRQLRGEELRDALLDGRLKSSTLVWRRGMKSWLPAATVPELMSHDAPSSESHDDSTLRRRRPKNLVDIAAIESQRGGKANEDGRRTSAATLAEFDDQAVDSKRPSTSGVDQGWSQAPSADDTDETAIRLRTEEDEEETIVSRPSDASDEPPQSAATRVRAEKAPASQATMVRGEGERKVPQSRRALPARSREGRTTGSQAPPPPSAALSRAAPRARAAVRSEEVLSQQFGSAGAISRPLGVSNALVSGDSRKSVGSSKVVVGVSPGVSGNEETESKIAEQLNAGARVHHKTAPLPEAVGDQRVFGVATPLLAHEPWQRPSEAPPPVAPQRRAILPGFGEASAGHGGSPPTTGINLALPYPAVISLVAGGVGLLILAFFGGRWSVPSSDGVEARSTTVEAETTAKPSVKAPPPEVSKPLRPCLMLRAPARWAPYASKSIPFEMSATPWGKLAIGYGRSIKAARGMLVDPVTGAVESRHTPAAGDVELSRVVPVFEGEQLVYQATNAEEGDVRNGVYVGAPSSFIVGFNESALVKLDKIGATPDPLWKLGDGERAPDALRAVFVPEQGVVVTYRHDKKIWSGWLGVDGRVIREATVIGTTEAKLGKPSVAVNGDTVTVVFANKPAKGEDIEMQWTRGPLNEALEMAKTAPLPEGGPGGQVIAPAIAALPQGRWLLMWTEGKSGARILRAQTYTPSLQAIGSALRVSPATGSFGQGMVGAVGQNGAVVFLLSARRSYEIWGTVLKCD